MKQDDCQRDVSSQSCFHLLKMRTSFSAENHHKQLNCHSYVCCSSVPPLISSVFFGSLLKSRDAYLGWSCMSWAYQQQEAAWRRRCDFCAKVTLKWKCSTAEGGEWEVKSLELVFTGNKMVWLKLSFYFCFFTFRKLSNIFWRSSDLYGEAWHTCFRLHIHQLVIVCVFAPFYHLS